jgi:hypothetical protein
MFFENLLNVIHGKKTFQCLFEIFDGQEPFFFSVETLEYALQLLEASVRYLMFDVLFEVSLFHEIRFYYFIVTNPIVDNIFVSGFNCRVETLEHLLECYFTPTVFVQEIKKTDRDTTHVVLVRKCFRETCKSYEIVIIAYEKKF